MGFGEAADQVGGADEGFDDVGEVLGGYECCGGGGRRGEDVVGVAGLPFCGGEALAEDEFVETNGQGGAGEEAVGYDFP